MENTPGHARSVYDLEMFYFLLDARRHLRRVAFVAPPALPGLLRPAPAVAASDAPAHADVLRADGGSSAGTGAGDNAERDLANARAADGSGVSVFAFSTLAKRRARRSSDSETTRATTADAGPPQEDALTRSNPASPTVAFELPACVAPAPPPCAGKIQVNSLRRCDYNPVALHRVTALRARFSKRTICSRGAPFDNNTNCTLIATQPQPACAASSSSRIATPAASCSCCSRRSSKRHASDISPLQ